MKIAYLLGSLNRGGTETLLLDVFRNAKFNKLNAIGVYRKTGVLEKEFKESGILMHKLSVGKNKISYMLNLRKFLTKNKIDIVHAQQPIDAFYAILATKGKNIKVLLTIHGYDFTEKKLGKFLLRFVIKRTNLNIYVSATQRQYYQEKYNLKIDKQKVIYNGISFNKLDNDLLPIQSNKSSFNSKIDKLHTELQLSNKTFLIGAVGNFNYVRDQMTICRFLKLLNEQKVDFHFVFVGKKIESSLELYNDCVCFCEENDLMEVVSFLGLRNDVPEILNELDAFIYSTNHDTFGIAVIEAMAVGIPVFVNDWEVMKETTHNGKYANLYKTKDEIDLLRIFMLFMDQKESFQIKAKEGAYFVREKFNIENNIKNLKSLYRTLYKNRIRINK
ncbi:MAG: glycosyltransferase [Bacteroidia bacterium]